MILHEIKFRLNESEAIILVFQNSLDMQHSCSPSKIVFIADAKKILLSNDSIQENMYVLRSLLTKALQNNLTLHESIEINNNLKTDIGYMYNEYRQDKPDVMYEITEGHKFESWIGNKYLLWASELITWIYNDNNGDILFKLTPNFPGKSTMIDHNEPSTPEEIENSQWYEEWIKDYKPFLIRKIPRETAQQWLHQANQILEQMAKNTQRMLEDGTFYTTPHYYNYEIKDNPCSAPKDGQKALDQSLQIKDNFSSRIGVSDGEIVIFVRTSNGVSSSQDVYHGHTIMWEEISSNKSFDLIVKNMIEAGLINKKGVPLK